VGNLSCLSILCLSSLTLVERAYFALACFLLPKLTHSIRLKSSKHSKMSAIKIWKALKLALNRWGFCVLMDRKQILASFPNLASMLGVRLFIVMKEVIEVYFSFFFCCSCFRCQNTRQLNNVRCQSMAGRNSKNLKIILRCLHLKKLASKDKPSLVIKFFYPSIPETSYIIITRESMKSFVI